MTPRRILIIRPDRVGDVVLTTPLIRSIRQSFPNAFLCVMVNPLNVPLLEQNPHIDEIITDDASGSDAGRKGFWKKVGLLRRYNFDTGLMPFPRERHAWMMFFAGIRTRIGVGHKLYEMLTFMPTVSRHKYIPLRHEADYMMDLGNRIGVTTHDLRTELFVSEEEKNKARERLSGMGLNMQLPIVGVNPLSRGSVPNWRPERYFELIERLIPRYSIAINLAPYEGAERVRFAALEKRGAVILMESLRDHMASVSQFDVLVSSSTGPMHIAAALKVPTVSIFCPLTPCSPLLWGPLGNRSEVLLPSADYCQVRCPKDPKICPLEDIEVQSVIQGVERIVKERKLH